jgi:GNAT superfamily N-acetyltransferase
MVVGFAIIDLPQKNVWALFVHPAWEAKGIGKRLHNKMLDWYFSKFDLPLWLSTAPGTRAEKFYYNQGWVQTNILLNGEVKFEMTGESWNQKSVKSH